MMLDNELNAEDSAIVAEHLSHCPECMRVFSAFQEISLSLDELEEVPDGFTEAVMHRIQTPTPAKKPRFGLWRVAGLAACLALVLFTGSRSITSHLQVDFSHQQQTARTADVSTYTPAPTETPTPQVQTALDEGSENENSQPDASTLMILAVEEETPACYDPPVTFAVPTPTPAPIVVPTPTPRPAPELFVLEDLLLAAEWADSELYTEAPAYEFTLQDPSGKDIHLAIWIDEQRIYCKDTNSGEAWFSAGSPEKLLELLDAAGLLPAQLVTRTAPNPEETTVPEALETPAAVPNPVSSEQQTEP